MVASPYKLWASGGNRIRFNGSPLVTAWREQDAIRGNNVILADPLQVLDRADARAEAFFPRHASKQLVEV